MTLETRAVDLADIAHIASDARLPVVIMPATYYGTRTLTVLTALYGPEKVSKRATEVLRILRREGRSR